MFPTEVDSFVRKFHQLWSQGITAHLDLDTHAGEAWVGLRVHLGHVPGPPHGPVFPSPYKHVPPSRQRRRARREAERKNKSEEIVKDIVEQTIVAGDTGKVPTDAKKNCSKKKEDAILNVDKTNDTCVIDEVCPDKEYNAACAEIEGEEDITVEFVSDYAEEDINDALKELNEKGDVTALPILVSRMRVTKRGAEHLCKVKLKIPSRERKSFSWPSLKDCPHFFKDVKIIL